MIVRKASSVACRQIWEASDEAVTSRLTYVEAASALAQAVRNGRISVAQHQSSLVVFGAIWRKCDVLDVDQSLSEVASSMAYDHALRGYDAVHCASAVRVQDPELVAVSGDRQLLEAWSAQGVSTFDINAGR